MNPATSPSGAQGAVAPELAWLRTPAAIRERCGQVLVLAERGELEHFELRPERLRDVARKVVEVTRAAHPTLRTIGYHARWRHFAAGGVDRAALLARRIGALPREEQARIRFELAITSVLLDAGAGERWRFHEAGGGTYARSEGLAVASLHLFLSGAFSGEPGAPRADAAGLAAVTPATIAAGFQVREDNPLVGVEGRAELLRRLGAAVAAQPALFGAEGRLGGLFDALVARSSGGTLPAREILAVVLEGLGPIWPARVVVQGVALGDVGRHARVRGPGASDGLVPFHKLSQWLSYSLLEPLEAAGLRVTGLDELTGLPEYRNGGLFLDLGALVPREAGLLARTLRPDEEPIVEWRALTVALLDRTATLVREELGLSADELPLAKVLEGGTWAAGRVVARERRLDGGPPLSLALDGTVF